MSEWFENMSIWKDYAVLNGVSFAKQSTAKRIEQTYDPVCMASVGFVSFKK